MLCAAILGDHALATTYYVDYANGSDTNSGTLKTSPWQHAPGMNGVSGLAASTRINPGDSVILKGCVTWPNAAFSWVFPYSGSSGSPIYVGVDKTWYDNAVTGCSSSWNRPIFDLQHEPPTDSLYRIINLTTSYVTYDNFEIIDVEDLPSVGNGSTGVFAFPSGPGSATNITVEDMYIHKWNVPVFAVGTGNVAASGTSVTNFVPFGYSPSVNTSWPTTYSGLVRLQSIPADSAISPGNSSPTVTSITGSNPYTINFTESPSNSGPGCTGCVIQIGIDNLQITEGVEGICSNCVMQDNVIDGSDSNIAQLNPYGDCGQAESNNQMCEASGTAGWRVPNIWRGNVIQYVASAFIGECEEWSNNLIQYLRIGADPTGHTNGIECVDEDAGSSHLFYDNVIRHTNNPNANTPGGRWSIGLFTVLAPVSGYTDYLFNNITYDGSQNVTWGLGTGSNCCGSVDLFDNTSDGGPSWAGQSYDMVNKCPSGYKSCTFKDNDLISNAGSSDLLSCGSNCSESGELVDSISAAANLGMTASEKFAYAPTQDNTSSSTSPQAGGISAVSLCDQLQTLGGQSQTVNTDAAYQAAYQACLLGTSYAVGYDTTTHTVVQNCPGPSRVLAPDAPAGTPVPAWDRGAYQWGPACSVNLTGTVTSQ